jgi:hypothetical protein
VTRWALLFGAGLLILSAAVRPVSQPAQAANAAPAALPEFTSAQSDYIEHCGGCHGLAGDSAPAAIPVLRQRVGYFMCSEAGRDYLLQLPNVAFSPTDNAQLADLMNYVVFGLGGSSTPRGARPFTEADVARLRPHPMTSVSLIQTRKGLVKGLEKQCGAPSSLEKLYPDRPGAASATSS